MKNNYIFLYCCCFLIISVFSKAQNYQFHSLNTREGLSNSSVNSMLVDSRGFLWVGTESGLNRYDGYEVKTYYKFGDKKNTSINSVASLQEDALGNLWIESTFPYARYLSSTQMFDTDTRAYLKSLGMNVSGEFKLKIDGAGNIWVCCTGRIYYYDFSSQKLKSWKVNLKVDSSNSIYVDCSAKILFLIHNDEINVLRENTGGQLQSVVLPENLRKGDNHYRIYVDPDGLLWVYSTVNENICCYDVYKRRVVDELHLPQHNKSRSNAIRDIHDDGKGCIWIATDHCGVFVYNKNNGQYTQIQHQPDEPMSLSSDNVTCMLFDSHGTMWMGHLKTGISYFNERYNYFISKGRSCGDISTMLYDRHGNLWLGTDGDGVFVEHSDGTVEKTSLPNITISSILEDGNGVIWVGTYNNGLYRMDGTRHFTAFTSETGDIPHNAVWQMAEDKYGRVWYSSAFGPLASFDPATGKGKKYVTPDGGTICGMCLEYDGENTLYVGTAYGVYVCDVNTGKGKMEYSNRSKTRDFLQQMVGSMCVDKINNILWLGHTGGLTAWDLGTDSIYYIDKSTGLFDNNVKSIVTDASGNVWISTGRGLSSIFVHENEASALSFTIRNFTTNEGLQSNYFNKFAATHGMNGEILMGGDEGYTVISSQRLHSEAERPVPVLAEIIVGDSSYNSMTDQLDLAYDDYQIVIKYFTGNLVNANHILYAYRLKGLHDEWVYTDDNKISFFSIAPGSYTLEVKACGEDGEWGEPMVLKIHVAPPFYRSWWMIILYVILLAGICFYVYRSARIRQLRRIEEHKANLEREQVVRLSEMKLRFFTNISHDLRTPLTLIISPLQTILKEPLQDKLRSKLEVISKNAELLLNQVNMLLDFRRLDVGAESLRMQRTDIVQYVKNVCLSFNDYSTDRGVSFECHSDVETLIMNFDPEKMGKIMYNLLSNAFKFTPDGGDVKVNVKSSGQSVIISVADSGCGVPDADKENIFQRFFQTDTDSPSAGSGIGLHIVKEYVTMHGGTVCVTDNKPQGSVFVVTLPVDTSHTDIPDSAENSQMQVREQDETAVRTGKYTVLVVDDNKDMCTFIADSLRDDYEVLTAENGEKALEAIRDNDVNLVVSDVMMPGVDGLELCKRIKTDVQTSHIPVILLTAKTADVAIVEGLQQGADDYITKPFNMEHLKLRIQKFVEWNDTRHAMFSQKIDIEPSEIAITPLDEQFVKDVMSIVESHISDETFSVEILGKEMGMSRTNLYKKLMNITGRGPHEFIRTVRMKRACRLLERSQKQIAEIAYEVGYSSPKRFSENFKNEYGMTPTEYVKNHNS